ncbi:hypothetical protein FRX31_025353 [Thalictrum thalictroides]|uniref:Uncharacterized protein n=1 Tax=Thalictrum thalictroides TaxID=46969 RepID=A0A7J6VLQ9_THATH|nr:hypothetical protein FRX31_025353 [Thalictrum thalictroides]
MDLQESSTSDDTEDTEIEPPLLRKEKKGRSATMCPKVTKLRDGEPRIIVSYNSRGQPIGNTKNDLASYEGLVARKVRITYENWKAVPKDVKKSCWKALKVKFVLKKDERRKRVSAIGASWKKFKSLLTTKYIHPFEDDPERLSICQRYMKR